MEAQAANGASLWGENFEQVTIAAPLIEGANDSRVPVWTSISDIRNADRISIEPLPKIRRIPDFFRHYGAGRSRLRELIKANDYLSFALWGLWDDWAAVAALESQRLSRKYSIWTDLVAHAAMKQSGEGKSFFKRTKATTLGFLMNAYHRQLIERSSLGLFHGADCFEGYRRYSSNPHLVHNIHLSQADQISTSELDNKVRSARTRDNLIVIYVGRASQEKGPFDWLESLERAIADGVHVDATWFGDGPLLADMQRWIDERALSTHIKLAGFVGDRDVILSAYRRADAFAFCHKTAESPRCLIEALKSGTPIVGYGSDYPRELTKNGGGFLTRPNDVLSLAESLKTLASNRDKLANLVHSAADSGAEVYDTAVFRHRSELIKEFV